MLLIVFILTFMWLKQDVGPVTETFTYNTMAECVSAKNQKITEKIGPQRDGLIVSRTLHADCREQ